MSFGVIWYADEGSSCPQAIRTIVSVNALSTVVERAFLMVELHLAFEYGLMQLPLHHDNVSLRL